MKQRFEVVVCCQGNPSYYPCKTLGEALFLYAQKYLTYNKYHTMNFTLRQTWKGAKCDVCAGTCHDNVDGECNFEWRGVQHDNSEGAEK